ncbi:MAG: hypothetical protein ACRD68_09680 [Pyrinomonadaceae bacterium]
MKKADRQRLALQISIEKLRNAQKQIELGKTEHAKLLIEWAVGYIYRSTGGGDDGSATAGIVCGCVPTTFGKADPNCERCHGSGLIPIAEIRARAELLKDGR